MTWHTGPMLAFDCETTGVDVETDRIVTAAVVMIDPGQAPQIRDTVINPGVDVPDTAAEVHGWTTERVQAEGKPPASELDWIANSLTAAITAGVPLVVANAPYDLTLLDRELRRHGLPTLADRVGGAPLAPVIDPMVVDKALDRYRPGKRRLTDLCATYEARIGDAHNCTEDALAAARVAYRLGQRAQHALTDPEAVAGVYADRRYPDRLVHGFQEFGRLDAAGAHTVQVGWYREQSAGLAQYFRRQANDLAHRAEGAEDDAERETLLADSAGLLVRADGVTADWPMRPFGGAV